MSFNAIRENKILAEKFRIYSIKPNTEQYMFDGAAVLIRE